MSESDAEIIPGSSKAEKPRRERVKQGTLRKKNSYYFKPEFAQKENEKRGTLRDKVRDQMRNSQAGTMRTLPRTMTRAMSTTMRKGSMMGMGNLTSMIDLAYLNLHADEDLLNADKLAERKEKQQQDEEYYWMMKQDPAYAKYKRKCMTKAKKEFDEFFVDTEKEVAEIEKQLGVDAESLERIRKKVMEKVNRQRAEEASKSEAKATPAPATAEAQKKPEEVAAKKDI